MQRVSTIAQHVLVQESIARTQGRIFDRQAQIASGMTSSTYAGLSKDASQLISMKAATARTESFITQNDQIESRLQITDGALSDMSDIASTLKAHLLQRLNDATGSASVLGQDASNMLSSVAGLLNTQIAGRFVFGGSKTDSPPVPEPVPDPAAFGVPDDNYYQGDSTELTARVSETQQVKVGMAGNRAGFQELVGALKAAIEGHNTNNKLLLDQAVDLASKAIEDINSYRSEGGFASNAVSRATAGHKDFQLYSEQLISNIQNVDVPSTVAALSADQTALQASYAIVGRMSNLSLANYLT